MISLLHTGSQDMEETQDEEEVVQEDLVVLQSNLLMSPPGQSHFATEATLEEDGYDSNNKINPMNTIINENSMEEDDAALPEVSDELAASGEQETQEYGGNFVNIPEDSLKKMKVPELKEELAKRGQSTQGLKAVLLEHLKEALGKHLPVLTGANQSAHTNDDLKGFAATAQWKPLVPQEVAVPKPENIVTTLHAPTVSRQDASFLPQKHNFAEVFDQFCQNGRAMLNNGQTVWTEQFTNFDPVTFAAVWFILGLNIGGSSKKALVFHLMGPP